jgi:hypothetical protein
VHPAELACRSLETGGAEAAHFGANFSTEERLPYAVQNNKSPRRPGLL